MSTLPINVLCAHIFIRLSLSHAHIKQNVLSTHQKISVFAFAASAAVVMDVMQSVRVHVVMN